MNCSSVSAASRLTGSRSLLSALTDLWLAAAASGAPPPGAEIAAPQVPPALAVIGDAKARDPAAKAVEARPNQVGVFTPRVRVVAQTPVPVRITFPEAGPGDRILASVEDGGKLTNGNPIAVLTLDMTRAARFTFTPDATDGLYRVTLRHRVETRTLEFWVGPEPKLAREK
jgi:hypothetical protein